MNKKIIETENYLGAKGHVIALNDDPNVYIHGHPDDHTGNKEVHFAFNFKQKGNYTLFAQFKVGGKVETYPFTVSVNAGDGTNTVQDESKPHGH